MPNNAFYHNPRCSKSRQALALLEAHGIEVNIIKYLDDTPDTEALKAVIKKLGITPRELLRTKESDYKALNLKDESISDEAILAAMAKHPKLIERPIWIVGDRAVIGRPPENVLTLK